MHVACTPTVECVAYVCEVSNMYTLHKCDLTRMQSDRYVCREAMYIIHCHPGAEARVLCLSGAL